MSKRKARIAIITESPVGFNRTHDAEDWIIDPVSEVEAVRCFSVLEGEPKNNKAATKTEIRNAAHVADLVKSYKYVVLVGNAPLQLITGKAGISKMRGRPFIQDGTIYLPMNNPSVIKHDPRQETIVQNDVDLLFQILDFGGIPREKSLDIRIVRNWDDVDEMVADIRGWTSFDIETNSLNPFQTHVWKKSKDGTYSKTEEPAKIVSLGFGTRKSQWILPVNHEFKPFDDDELQTIVDKITEECDTVKWIMHNGKFDALWMVVHFGVWWHIEFDTMLCHYLIDENSRHGLKYLAQTLLNAPDWDVGLEAKQGKASFQVVAKYHAHDLYYTRKLMFKLKPMIEAEPGPHQVFEKLLMPVANLFVEIEYDGVCINMEQFEDAEEFLREQYNSALEDLAEWEPPETLDSRGRPVAFNWGSTKQLGDLLYKQLKLPVIEKTPTGNPSCSESVIKRLNHPCTEALLKFREAKQQLSFFIDGWKPYLHERPDGVYLHPSFKLHGTVTGRLSCENPNLQQVPRDKRIRTLITAPEGWTLIECDLSQVELRVAAELADERAMIHAFVNGIDVHWLTAMGEIERGGGLKDLVIGTAQKISGKKMRYADAIAFLIGVGPDEAIEANSEWKEYRKKAKAVNFGYLYGMWWKKFKDYARDSYGVILDDTEAEASRVAFFDNYSDLPDWHKKQRNYARRHGFVASLTGRKRRLPDAMEWNSSNTQKKMAAKAAERQAINSPVQSFANDINLMAALQLREEFGRRVVRICGTVHDAVLFRVRNDMVPTVYKRMLEIMQRPRLFDDFDIELSVPIEADGEIGPWGAGVTLDKWEKAT